MPLTALLVTVAALAAAGCGESIAATPTPPAAEDLRDATVDRLRALSSVHFEISHVEGATVLGEGLLLNTVEGDAAFPDRASMRAAATAFNVPVEFGIVQIVDVTYFSGPFGDTWRIVEPGSLPFDFVGMHDSVANALAMATELAVAEADRDAYVLTGRIFSQDIRGLVPNTPAGEPLELAVRVGRTDSLPRSVRLTGKLVAEDPPGMTRVLELRDYDREVSIQPPI